MSTNQAYADVQLLVNLGAESDTDALDQSTRLLKSEIQEYTEYINLVSGEEAPKGTRSTEIVTIGALGMSILPTVLPELIKYLHSWCIRAEQRSIEIEIKRSKNRSVKLKIMGNIPIERLLEIISTIEKSD